MKTALIYVLVVLWFAAAAAVVAVFGLLGQPPLRPPQPIEFTHAIHAGQLGIECLECHRYADKSIYAGLPDAEFCMGCHEGVATDRPEIVKLTKMFQAGEPVDWVRIYSVKPFVYFTHKRHVLSGIKCQQCHGPVELMTTVQRVTDLGMGWCVGCHTAHGAPKDCDTCHK